MSDRTALPATGGTSLLPALTPDDLTPEFRVVARGGVRRGIRLEHGFWTALKGMAERRRCTIGMLVEEIARHADEAGNLTSAIRVACLRSMGEENLLLRKLASIKTINAIISACPAPAFALETSKKILTFNSAFQQLVRRQLPASPGDDGRPDLKLALDLSVSDIFARLAATGDAPVLTGFIIGAGDRRYRGQLNVVRAPVAEPELLMAFVSNS